MLVELQTIVVQIQFSYHFKVQTSRFQLGVKTSQNASQIARNFKKHKLPRISNCPEFRTFRHILIQKIHVLIFVYICVYYRRSPLFGLSRLWAKTCEILQNLFSCLSQKVIIYAIFITRYHISCLVNRRES